MSTLNCHFCYQLTADSKSNSHFMLDLALVHVKLFYIATIRDKQYRFYFKHL